MRAAVAVAEVGAAEVEVVAEVEAEAVVPLVALAPPTAGSASVPAPARVLVPAQVLVPARVLVRAPAGQPPIQPGTKTATGIGTETVTRTVTRTVTKTATETAIVSVTSDRGDTLATSVRTKKAPQPDRVNAFERAIRLSETVGRPCALSNAIGSAWTVGRTGPRHLPLRSVAKGWAACLVLRLPDRQRGRLAPGSLPRRSSRGNDVCRVHRAAPVVRR